MIGDKENYNKDEYTPVRLSIRRIAVICASVLVLMLCLTFMATGTWIIVCLLDNKPPIEMITYRADNTYIGEKVPVTVDAVRTRNCEYKFSRMATDSKGRIVYEDHGERPVNGPTRHVLYTDYYPIDRRAAPGTATFHLYAKWQCPNNIIHRFKPIEEEYKDTFELVLKPGDKDLSGDLLKEPENFQQPEDDRR